MKISSDYYNALVDSYVNTIFESGLLLDEDLQILLNYYKSDERVAFPDHELSLALKLSVSALLGSLFLAREMGKAFLLPPIIGTGIAAMFEMKKLKKRKSQQLIMQDLVNISKKINSLNSSIRKYVKMRIEIENKSQNDLFTGYTKQIDTFFKDTLSSEITFFETLKKTIKTIVDFSDELTDDFSSFEHFQPFDELKQIDNLQNGLDFLNKTQDLHIWLTSKFLCYISIMFFFPNEELIEKVYDEILNVQLRNLVNFFEQHYDITRKRFYALKNIVAKFKELKSNKQRPHISNKLQKTLLSAIDNLSVISEKSKIIIDEIENSDGRTSETLHIAMNDLRYHTFAVYESIDLLCKLYGILSTQQIPAEKTIGIPQSTKDFTLTTVNHDDLVDVTEENFELYLDKDNDDDVLETNSYQEDSSGAYLNLMLKELRQSLGKHERFIEAKKRRGSVDAEVSIEKNEAEIPNFDLNALKSLNVSSKTTDVSDSKSPKQADISNFSTPSCPPPPPPLPKDNKMFDVKDSPTTSIIDGIKVLSRQLKMEEEVFGESTDKSEDKE